MKKRIAVLYFNYEAAREWVRSEYDVKGEMMASKKFILVNDIEVYMISQVSDAAGMTFQEYRISPDFNHLEAYIKSLIKQ